MDFLIPRRVAGALALLLAVQLESGAAEPPVRLVVKPLLCVLDKAATSCLMSFDIRWKSLIAGEYCLNDTVQPAPRMCWGSGRAGNTTEKREVGEEFVYWIGAPAGTERLAEVKISVLRVGSPDRRRERRTRHVWDVL